MNTKQETEDAINNATTNESIHDSNSNFYSSLLQLSITPTSLMLFSSLPLIGGSYLGYKKQMRVIANETNPSNMKFAFRAFGVGSMLSVGGFGIITAGKSIVLVRLSVSKTNANLPVIQKYICMHCIYNHDIFLYRYILCNKFIFT